jgi:pimeloyl-ACP methyl ester carboxylesterase
MSFASRGGLSNEPTHGRIVMSDLVRSADGTSIAFDRYGQGDALILVGGAFQFRALDPGTTGLARRLAEAGLSVFDYDRRGRGESVAHGPFGLDREVEDIAALIEVAGGKAALYGSSSGGAIALAAAAAGLPVTRLALWEVPLDDELGNDGAEFLSGLRAEIAQGNDERVVEFFMQDMPREWLEGSRQSPAWPLMTSVARSLEADAEALGWTQTKPRAALWDKVIQPTLVLLGEETLPFMPAAADSVVAALPSARLERVPVTADHTWDPTAMTMLLSAFFGTRVPSPS